MNIFIQRRYMKQIQMPTIEGMKTVESEQCFVIVGANGSGKSHLGAYIEGKNNNNALRISAQRSLTVPDFVTVKTERIAWNKIFYGNEKEANKGYKWNWGNATTTKLIDDYNSVLEAVFARIANEKGGYFDECRICEDNDKSKPKTPQIIADKIIDIWNAVFPHRSIIIKDNTITAKTDKEEKYPANQMSDGERVAIYLIGQCLVAPDNMMIIIDEPEIHMHKAIMHKLWDKIEEYCPNKTFVYITHDLDFAVSRKDAAKIWVKSYERNHEQEKWSVEVIEDSDIIPEALLLEILGNRKDVLFVEGEKGSYDTQLYSAVYDSYYVVPCHNCYKVIEYTKAFNDSKIQGLHNINVRGIIDRDFMSEGEIESYKKNNIFALDVAEVENLFLLEEIQRIVASNQALEDVDHVISMVKSHIFSEFKQEQDNQILLKFQRELAYKMQCNITETADSKDSIKNKINTIDIDGIYNEIVASIDQVLYNNDYVSLLKIYNRKNLHKQISKYYNITDYPNLVIRLLKTDKRNEIVNALKAHLPQI